MRCDIKNYWKPKKKTAHQILVHDYIGMMLEARTKNMQDAAKHWENITEMRKLMWADYGLVRENNIKTTGIDA